MIGNALLAGLDDADRDRIVAALHSVTVEADEMLFQVGERCSKVYFPESACLAEGVEDGDAGFVHVTHRGREGALGLGPALSDEPQVLPVKVVASGVVQVCDAALIRELSGSRPALLRRFLATERYYHAQTSLTAACNALHRVEARLGRWLLSVTDCAGRPTVALTQDTVAQALAVQRTSAVSGIGRLRSAGMVRHMRGRLELRDRSGLIASGCGCHERLERIAEILAFRPGVARAPMA